MNQLIILGSSSFYQKHTDIIDNNVAQYQWHRSRSKLYDTSVYRQLNATTSQILLSFGATSNADMSAYISTLNSLQSSRRLEPITLSRSSWRLYHGTAPTSQIIHAYISPLFQRNCLVHKLCVTIEWFLWIYSWNVSATRYSVDNLYTYRATVFIELIEPLKKDH